MNNLHWTSIWGNAVSIAENRPESFSKNITLRYPIHCPFDGNGLKLTFDNYCGTESIKIVQVTILVNDIFYDVLFDDTPSVAIEPGKSVVSDEIDVYVSANDTIQVSFYLEDYTQMRSAVYVQGPLSGGSYCIGDGTSTEMFSIDTSRKTNIVYFLTDVSIRTSERNHSILCYGDSITAQDWPDYLQMMFDSLQTKTDDLQVILDSTQTQSDNSNAESDKKYIPKAYSVIRKATSGSRILREYSCITYESYGLKATNRFCHEVPSANGIDTIIIQQGINDIIHPVGVDVNPFRPMSDLPTIDELIEGFKYYITEARKLGLKIYVGTLLPIKGWRTYADFRDVLRNQFNEFLRTTDLVDGCIDFDAAVRDPKDLAAFLPVYDSGDHLHPSAEGYKAMAQAAYEVLKVNKD